jgi:hypothetical protein
VDNSFIKFLVLAVLVASLGLFNGCDNGNQVDDETPDKQILEYSENVDGFIDINIFSDDPSFEGNGKIPKNQEVWYHIDSEIAGWGDPISLAIDLLDFIKERDIDGFLSCINPDTLQSETLSTGSSLEYYAKYTKPDEFRLDKIAIIKSLYYDEFGNEITKNEYWQIRADMISEITKNHEDYYELSSEELTDEDAIDYMTMLDEINAEAREEVNQRMPPVKEVYEDRYFVYLFVTINEYEYSYLTIEIIKTKEGYFVNKYYLSEEYTGGDV